MTLRPFSRGMAHPFSGTAVQVYPRVMIADEGIEAAYAGSSPMYAASAVESPHRVRYFLMYARSVNQPVTALITPPRPARIGSISRTRPQLSGVSTWLRSFKDPSMRKILPAIRARKARKAPSVAANTASSTNGAWMNQFEAPTSFMTATVHRLLYAATWMVLATSSSAAIPIATETTSAMLWIDPMMPKIFSSSFFWSTTCLIPAMGASAEAGVVVVVPVDGLALGAGDAESLALGSGEAETSSPVSRPAATSSWW